MWEINDPEPVKLIVGILAANGDCLRAAVKSVTAEFGECDLESEVFGEDHDVIGLLIQAGYQIPNTNWEPFVRYEYIDFDDAYTDGLGNDYDEVNIITLGVNHYFAKHNAKFTLDVLYALDPLPVKEEGLGLRADGLEYDEQIVLRAQFQLLF